jgi:hypothetical protein
MELHLVKTHRANQRETGHKQMVVRADVARVPVAPLEAAVAECAWAAAE